ncbi:MAG: cytochrome-c peroxidase, partial [Halieaceae bacterium]
MPLIASLWLGTTWSAPVFAGTPESTPQSYSPFSLSDTCPASFELKDGGCILRNRYREYRSLRDAGVGGLKTGLPPLREG